MTARKPPAGNQPVWRQANPHGDVRKALEHALADAETAGLVVPCRGPESEAWTAEDAETLQAAALYCEDCPALTECQDYAVTAGEAGGAWGALLPAEISRERRRNQERTRTDRAA